MEYRIEFDKDTQYQLDRIDEQIDLIYQSYLLRFSYCKTRSDKAKVQYDMNNDLRIRDLVNQRCYIESRAVPKIIIRVDNPEEIHTIKERLGIK